jgi:hypothetical protein
MEIVFSFLLLEGNLLENLIAREANSLNFEHKRVFLTSLPSKKLIWQPWKLHFPSYYCRAKVYPRENDIFQRKKIN